MSIDSIGKGMVISELQGLDVARVEGLRIQKQISRELEQEILDLRRENEELKKANKAAADIGQILRLPLAEIAERNSDFRQNYEELMTHLAEWMVSQKAFKELAIQFGLEKALTLDEVIAKGDAKKFDVLENKHPPEHGSNAEGIPIIKEKTQVLKKRLETKKKAREAEALTDRAFDKDFSDLVTSKNLLRVGDEPSGWKQAFHYWLKLAMEGVKEAQHNVGWCYQFGKGVSGDDSESIAWYTKALNQNVAATPYFLYRFNKWDSDFGFTFVNNEKLSRKCIQLGVSLGQTWAVELDEIIKQDEKGDAG
jgi:hypothetical protein